MSEISLRTQFRIALPLLIHMPSLNSRTRKYARPQRSYKYMDVKGIEELGPKVQSNAPAVSFGYKAFICRAYTLIVPTLWGSVGKNMR